MQKSRLRAFPCVLSRFTLLKFSTKIQKKMIPKRFIGEKSHYFSIICILTKQKSWHIICYY